MTITRWSPIHDVAVLQNRLNSLFEGFAGEEGPSASFVPAVDIYEDSQKLVLKLEIPGVKEQDLDIRLENQTLTVKGERKFSQEEKQENFHRIERRFGSFVRSFTLPNTVDTDSVSAEYEAGVLAVTVAKKPEAKPKQIPVTHAARQVEGTIEQKTA